MKKAKEQAKAELEAESSFVDLFGLDSSQSQRSDAGPPSPPCRRRKRRLEERHDVANDNEDGGGDDGGGGKHGGIYGDSLRRQREVQEGFYLSSRFIIT